MKLVAGVAEPRVREGSDGLVLERERKNAKERKGKSPKKKMKVQNLHVKFCLYFTALFVLFFLSSFLCFVLSPIFVLACCYL